VACPCFPSIVCGLNQSRCRSELRLPSLPPSPLSRAPVFLEVGAQSLSSREGDRPHLWVFGSVSSEAEGEMVVSKLTAAFFFLAALEPARSFAPSAGSRSLSGIPFAIGRGPLSRQGEGIPTARLGLGASPLSKNERALSRVWLAGGVANWGRQTCLSAAESGGGGDGGGEVQHRLPPKLDELATYIGSSADEREVCFSPHAVHFISVGSSRHACPLFPCA
jgi:hypothetical protein